jgi:hypothetical protein
MHFPSALSSPVPVAYARLGVPGGGGEGSPLVVEHPVLRYGRNATRS